MRAGLAVLLIAAALGARAGGDFGAHDEVGEPGLTYFGFVKDARGRAIADAKVVMTIRKSTRIVMHTNKAGMYRVGNLTPDIKLDDVAITCEKQGYKQTGVVRRTTRPVPGKPIEIECRMDRA